MATKPTTPAGKVHFDADRWDKERDQFEPFVFMHNTQRFEMGDPADHDWRVLRDVQAPGREDDFMRLMLSPAGYVRFVESGPCTARKLSALMQAARDHYGLGDEGN